MEKWLSDKKWVSVKCADDTLGAQETGDVVHFNPENVSAFIVEGPGRGHTKKYPSCVKFYLQGVPGAPFRCRLSEWEKKVTEQGRRPLHV